MQMKNEERKKERWEEDIHSYRRRDRGKRVRRKETGRAQRAISLWSPLFSYSFSSEQLSVPSGLIQLIAHSNPHLPFTWNRSFQSVFDDAHPLCWCHFGALLYQPNCLPSPAPIPPSRWMSVWMVARVPPWLLPLFPPEMLNHMGASSRPQLIRNPRSLGVKGTWWDISYHFYLSPKWQEVVYLLKICIIVNQTSV